MLFSYYMSQNPAVVDGLIGVQVFLTSQDYGDRLQEMKVSNFRERGLMINELKFGKALESSSQDLVTATVHVDRNTKYQVGYNIFIIECNNGIINTQSVIGFGGAFTEASAHNFYKLPLGVQNKFMDLYFGEDGIGFNVGRIHINSCDFSLESYSFDDVKDDFKVPML